MQPLVDKIIQSVQNEPQAWKMHTIRFRDPSTVFFTNTVSIPIVLQLPGAVHKEYSSCFSYLQKQSICEVLQKLKADRAAAEVLAKQQKILNRHPIPVHSTAIFLVAIAALVYFIILKLPI